MKFEPATGSLFYKPDECGYDITVIWPDGKRTNCIGVRLTSGQICEALEELIAKIKAAHEQSDDIHASA